MDGRLDGRKDEMPNTVPPRFSSKRWGGGQLKISQNKENTNHCTAHNTSNNKHCYITPIKDLL